MAGRKRLPHRELPLARAPHPALIEDSYRSAVLEDRVIAHHREIQALLLDNQRLAVTHAALKQELLHVSAASVKVKADRDAQVRELYERSLKVEAELRSVDAAHTELTQVRAEIAKLMLARQELALKLQEINGEVQRARAELQQAPTIKTEIDSILLELQRGRAAIEYEKKVHSDNLEHDQAMQKHMTTMAHEIEKLRAELANAEKRARATAAANPGPVYSGGYGSPEMGYGGTAHADPYSMPEVLGGADAGSQYGSGTVSHSPYDMQQSHLHR